MEGLVQSAAAETVRRRWLYEGEGGMREMFLRLFSIFGGYGSPKNTQSDTE
jgi:hypothetical protein